ncbi:reverse transcriptase [Artemisia annua]|uniref:Reverse transcriptase n=1 Tax=Artemisia annua TaxID=35608 RepID=A0A2U1PJF4_ARTAN|nr:reverse transcriptase [Artemisia annua]
METNNTKKSITAGGCFPYRMVVLKRICLDRLKDDSKDSERLKSVKLVLLLKIRVWRADEPTCDNFLVKSWGWSDHIPLMLHVEKIDYGPTPFKFFHSWMHKDGFEDCIKSAYDECSHGNEGLNFHEKLKVIKQKIKAWYQWVKHADLSRKQEVILRIMEIDENIDKCIASDIEKQEHFELLIHAFHMKARLLLGFV